MHEKATVHIQMSIFLYLHVYFFADRPIASIAFHAEGELLAVAAGHKVFIPTSFLCLFGLSLFLNILLFWLVIHES